MKDKDYPLETDYPEGFCKEPFCTYEGHSGDVLDLSWSKVLLAVYFSTYLGTVSASIRDLHFNNSLFISSIAILIRFKYITVEWHE